MNFQKTICLMTALLVLPILACISLSAPFASPSQETRTPAAPAAFTETASVAAPTQAPSATTASVPQVTPQNQSLPPTATLFPEQQLETVTDETGAIEASLPTTWTERRTEAWVDSKGKEVGTTLIAAMDLEGFLKFQAEGVSISVSRRLPIGYVQLLENEYKVYSQDCDDSYKTRWKLEDPVYNGMYFVFGECAGTEYTWLSLFTAVSKKEPGKYIVRVVAYDMIPIYGEDFRIMVMKFKVNPEKLP
jgi:hypothetical protein